jgi:outer membrane protein OmpA-like peptidoglycan-associated protein
MDVALAPPQNQVCPGGVITITPSATFPNDATIQWTLNGEATSSGPAFEFGSAGRAPGVYNIGLRVTAPGYDESVSETSVRVLDYKPPSGSLQAAPAEIWAGEKSRISANFSPGQCGGSLGPVAFTASEGSVEGTEFDSSGVHFDPADRSEQRKTVTITAKVTDQGGSASAEDTVIVKKKAALVATRLPDIIFPARSARVNNCGKRVLLEMLKSYTANDPTGKVVLVGHTAESEHAQPELARHRALNAAAVISSGQGICTNFPASQIMIGGIAADANGVEFQPHFCGASTDSAAPERSGQTVSERDEHAKERRVEVWFVPTGGVVPSSTADYADAVSLSVASLGCPK